MALKFKFILFINLFIGSLGGLEASDDCQCLKVTTYRDKLTNNIQYSAQCYANGKQTQLVVSTTFNSDAAGNQTTQTLRNTYGTKSEDCIESPDGSMILLKKEE